MIRKLKLMCFWLVGGVVLLVVLWLIAFVCDLKDTGSPWPGVYHSSFSTRCCLVGAESYCTLDIEGESGPEWCWDHRRNPTYQVLSLNWKSDFSEAEAIVTLPELKYQYGMSKGILTGDVLCTWIAEPDSREDPELLEAIEAVMTHIRSAGAGTLPRPRHHSHFQIINPDMFSTISTHHTQGGVYLPAIPTMVWLVLWSAIMWRMHARWFRRKGTPAK